LTDYGLTCSNCRTDILIEPGKSDEDECVEDMDGLTIVDEEDLD